jgi:hypothetical protein
MSMERTEVLILKLLEQYRKKELPDVLQQTLQQIQQELALSQQSSPIIANRNKVSVVMPHKHKPVVTDVKVTHEEKIVQVLQVDEAEVEKELEMMKQSAELKNEMGLKLRPPVQEQLNQPEVYTPMNGAIEFDPIEIDEIPTLATHIPPPIETPPAPTEVVVVPSLQEQEEQAARDLNEKLKEIRKEVAQKLQDVPIKDLRKAIGINDRYLYINELFSGDEAMFERSVKTLNQFSILPEAEFWMQRELRIKLGWKEDNLLVQQFVQLVRRRFA